MNAVTDVQLRRNINRTLAFGFFQVFLVIMPVIVPFFETRGLTMQQIFLLQAVFAVVVLVMEIPSGYAADLLGRRVTLLVGSVFIALGHTMLLFADGFAGLAVFELCLGIGVSLVSGTDLAILYDSEQALTHNAGSAAGTGRAIVHDPDRIGGVCRGRVQRARAVVDAGSRVHAGRRRLDPAADRAESRRAAR